MRRWREYFAELLNGPDSEEDEEETFGITDQSKK
jgi:hypothetical protein